MNRTDTAPSTLVGTAVPRREDPRLLTGRGRFVDDIQLPRMLHAQFVRASVASGGSPPSTCPRCAKCPV